MSCALRDLSNPPAGHSPPRRRPIMKRRPPRKKAAAALPPESNQAESNASTTSDYGTLSRNDVLSTSLSNMSLEESTDYTLQVQTIDDKCFCLIPTRSHYNLRRNFALSVTPTALSLGNNLVQFGGVIRVTKFSLLLPALFCLGGVDHARVHVFRNLLGGFSFHKTIHTKDRLLVLPIDSEGSFALFRSLVDPVIRYALVTPTEPLKFVLLEQPLIQITFQKGAVRKDVKLKSEVSFDELEEECLASPLISLTPHGVEFEKEVEIRIEVGLEPSGGKLQVFVDRQNKCPCWSQITNFKILRLHRRTFVSFHVRHFSVFKVVWDGVKRGIGGLLSTFSLSRGGGGSGEVFPMKCQASMDEYENNHFGLEISVYNAQLPFPSVLNYSHVVGRSLSKLVKSGRLTVALKSSLFEADLQAGEELLMSKDEEDFKGQDFSKDFACIFKGDMGSKRGPFGKVVVTRKDAGKTETLFQFNIQKSGNESVQEAPTTNNEQWTTMPLEELASNLFVTDSWKKLAKNLGFTRIEIKKFKNSPQGPFLSLIESYKARGGTIGDLLKSIYEVHRELKMSSELSNSPLSNSPVSIASSRRTARSQRSSSGLGSSRMTQPTSSESESDDRKKVGHSPSVQSLFKEVPRKRKARKVQRKKKKRRYEQSSSSSSSTESDSSDHRTNKTSSHSKCSDRQMRSDMTLLSVKFFWELSVHMTSSNWKALGRTLQLEEATLISIEQNHKASGNRECFYQVMLSWQEKLPRKCTFGTLYSGLMKESMAMVAKKMSRIGND